MTIAVDAVGHEQAHSDEDKSRDPERDEDRVVDVSPVRGDGRPPLRDTEMKGDGANDHHNHPKREDHVFCILNSGSSEHELLVPHAVSHTMITPITGGENTPPRTHNP